MYREYEDRQVHAHTGCSGAGQVIAKQLKVLKCRGMARHVRTGKVLNGAVLTQYQKREERRVKT